MRGPPTGSGPGQGPPAPAGPGSANRRLRRGQGVRAPAAFLFATIVLIAFSVGYVAMARKRTSAGGFYSYISHGLGRELGTGFPM